MGFFDNYGVGANAAFQAFQKARESKRDRELEDKKLTRQEALDAENKRRWEEERKTRMEEARMRQEMFLLQKAQMEQAQADKLYGREQQRGMMNAATELYAPQRAGAWDQPNADPDMASLDMRGDRDMNAPPPSFGRTMAAMGPYLKSNDYGEIIKEQMRQSGREPKEKKKELRMIYDEKGRGQPVYYHEGFILPEGYSWDKPEAEKGLHFTTETKYNDKTKLSRTRTVGRNKVNGQIEYEGDWSEDPTKGREVVVNFPQQQSQFIDPETKLPLIFDKAIGKYRVAEVDKGGVAPRQRQVPADKLTGIQGFQQLEEIAGDLEKAGGNIGGPVKGRARAALVAMGVNDPAFVEWRNKIGTLRPIIYSLSGKQINPTEQEWLEKEILPNFAQPSGNYAAALKQFKSWVKSKREGEVKALSEGGYVVPESLSSPKSRFTIKQVR